MSVDLWLSLLQKSPVMAIRWGADSAVISVSGGTEHFSELNIKPESNYLENIHPGDREAVIEHYRQHQMTELDVNYRLLDVDGNDYPVREYSQPCKNEPGVREGVLILQQTQKTQSEITELMERLASCEKELQGFAYVASHDLMEPLRKIQAFGGRLDQKYSAELGEKGQDYLARMLNATERLQLYLNGLLEYSRVNTRGKPPSRCDLKLICAEQVARLGKLTSQLDARIAIGDLPSIEADCSQMRQLFQHLLENALKFHNEGVRPIIAVSCEVNRDKVFIRFHDNGMGFAQHDAEKTFQIFQRLHGRSQYTGAGIGLAVCKRIVERHGGQIHAQSSPGSGSTFTITLPVIHNSTEVN